jgi:D-alanine-D-alanine ligase
VLPLAEVIYTALPEEIPPIMSYAAKWLETTTEYQQTYIECPADVEPAVAEKIGKVALRAFRAVGAWGYGRVDVRLDELGEPCVLDVNCNCCLDEGMGIARSAEKAGISYPQLLQIVLKAALERPHHEVNVPMVPPEVPRRREPAAAVS